MELTRFDVITGKGRSNEGVGNENYKALVEDNKVCRLVASSSLLRDTDRICAFHI